MAKHHNTVLAALKKFGLAFPGAHSKSPWPEHDDLAVKGKTFAFMGVAGVPLHMSVKLTVSHAQALQQPFAKPTGYGLGKSGWVTLAFDAGDKPPVELLKRWILESYRAVAPKKMIAELEAQQPWTRMGVTD
ncbi:MAG: DifB protein [Ramlibacter sp.]|nr:DifB protein [Ramlibacter sp.]